jgi:hypothetical protein
MVMPCSRSAARPSTSSAKSILSPWVPSLGVRFEGGELVFEHHLGIVEQAADQGRLAVIDGAAGDEAEQVLVLVRFEIGFDVGRDEIVVQASSEIALLLLLFHGGGLVLVDDAALAFGGGGDQHFLDVFIQRGGLAFDRAGQRIAAQRAEADRIW